MDNINLSYEFWRIQNHVKHLMELFAKIVNGFQLLEKVKESSDD